MARSADGRVIGRRDDTRELDCIAIEALRPVLGDHLQRWTQNGGPQRIAAVLAKKGNVDQELESGDKLWTVRVQALECTERRTTMSPIGDPETQTLALMNDEGVFAEHFENGSESVIRIEAARARELVHATDGCVERVERSTMWKDADRARAEIRKSATLTLTLPNNAEEGPKGPIVVRLGKARRVEMVVRVSASTGTPFREVARIARAKASRSPNTRWSSAIPWEEANRYIAWVEVAGVRYQAPEGTGLRELYTVRVVRLVEEWMDVVIEGVREPSIDMLNDTIAFADEDGGWHDEGSTAEYIANIRAMRSTGTELELNVPAPMRMLERL